MSDTTTPAPDTASPDATEGGSVSDGAASILGLMEPDEGDPADGDGEGDDAGEADPETPDGEASVDADPDAGDADPDADGEEGTEDAPDTRERTVTVKLDGKEVALPLAEVVAGYQRQADYTRKTQELAEDRKAVAAERAQYADLLPKLADRLRDEMGAEPDWAAVKQDDPLGFPERYADWQIAKTRLDGVKAEAERASASAAKERSEKRAATLRAEADALKSALPGWSDPKIAAREKAAILATAREVGFTDAEIASVEDHRAIVLLRDAALYRRAKAQAAAATPAATVAAPSRGAPPTVSRQQSEVRRASERLNRTGSFRDAAAVISHML